MAFLDPHVLTSFLRGYIEYRTPYWDKLLSHLQSYVRDDKKLKTEQCVELNKSFYVKDKFSTLEGCLKIIFKLGNEGREKNSVLAETKQAMKSYIVDCILESEYKDEFLEIRRKLREEVNKQQKEVEEAYISPTSAKDLKENKKIYYDNLLKLADLGEMLACGQADWHGLFQGLRKSTAVSTLHTNHDINEKIPFSYQEKFHEIFYDVFIRPSTKWQVDFQKFVEISKQLSSDVVEKPAFVEIKEISEHHPSNQSFFGKIKGRFFSNVKPENLDDNNQKEDIDPENDNNPGSKSEEYSPIMGKK